MKFMFICPCDYRENVFKCIDGRPIRVTLAERPKVSLDHRYLSIFKESSNAYTNKFATKTQLC